MKYLENKTDQYHQMASPFCFFKKPLVSWVAVLVLSPVFAGFLSLGFLSSVLFIAIVLIVSVSFLTFTKQKPASVVNNSVTEEVPESTDDLQDAVSMKQPESETMTPHKEKEEEEEEEEEELKEHQIQDYSLRSSADMLSESESFNHPSTSEDSEVDWPFQDIVYQSPDCSDGSISDEESLIEIALPSGHYVEPKEEVGPKFSSLQQSILKQHGLMELLAEINDMNEEDNLIEIDISMGSIKCSRLEIEA
ncbi:uncharacterized protein LOC123217533 [Mangifera indica]|uniref:uncharacterized protein LOC123217533 n=1 Tax=Mangifera indica TaxID=29780 RepID=UPI001CFC0100|nr:uncharacterized protein LOC123217533 [Mangifera indica]